MRNYSGGQTPGPGRLSEWVTWGHHCHLTPQSSAVLRSQDEKPCFPVLETHFLKTQAHTSTTPFAGGQTAHLAHLACCLSRVCFWNSGIDALVASFKLFGWLAFCFTASSQCVCVCVSASAGAHHVQHLVSIRINTWPIGHCHRTSLWGTRINLFHDPLSTWISLSLRDITCMQECLSTHVQQVCTPVTKHPDQGTESDRESEEWPAAL